MRTSAAGVFGHLLSGGGRCPQEPRDPAESRALRFRALAAAAIGIFCLFTLLAYRAVLLHRPGFAAPDSAAATVAQFRDFVSGCIGCLIGSRRKIMSHSFREVTNKWPISCRMFST